MTARLTKAGGTFNALTGLGIRKCGLTMATCNIIFWSIVVPVALYSCEVWRLNDGSVREPSGQMYVQCTFIVRTSSYIRIWYG